MAQGCVVVAAHKVSSFRSDSDMNGLCFSLELLSR